MALETSIVYAAAADSIILVGEALTREGADSVLVVNAPMVHAGTVSKA